MEKVSALAQLEQQNEYRDAIEHKDMILSVRFILSSEQGRNFIYYLFKSFQVGELPGKGIEGSELFETLGYLRSGKALFSLVCEADEVMAARLLAKKEKYELDLLERERQAEQGG